MPLILTAAGGQVPGRGATITGQARTAIRAFEAANRLARKQEGLDGSLLNDVDRGRNHAFDVRGIVAE